MGLINWIKQRREEKLKDKTIPQKSYWVWWHKITNHAVQRMNGRKITKGEVHENLTTRPIHKTKVKWDNKYRPSYERTSKNKITTAINPFNQKVVTVRRTHTSKVNSYLKNNRRKIK